MSAILIDFETTGLDTSLERIIEIGAQVVDDNWEVLGSLSCLVRGDGFPPLTSDIQEITGISQEVLNKEGLALSHAWRLLSELVPKDLSFAIAFNRQFDESIFRAEMSRTGYSLMPGLNQLLQVPWVCAMADIETNYMYKSWKLSHLSLEYGVTVNPKVLHRAINDVELMRQMLVAAGTTPNKMLEFQAIPWVYVQAKIEKPWLDGGKSKNDATKRGFSWEKARGDDKLFPKTWVKRIKAHQLENEQLQAPFKMVEIRNA